MTLIQHASFLENRLKCHLSGEADGSKQPIYPENRRGIWEAYRGG